MDLDDVPEQFRPIMQRIERAKKTTDAGVTYWHARELAAILGYKWRLFQNVMEKAKAACRESGADPKKHFVSTYKMVGIGSGAEREVSDVFLTRGATYLTLINGNPLSLET